MKSSMLFFLVLCSVLMVCPVQAVVISFDDLIPDTANGGTDLTGSGYGGLTWGTSSNGTSTGEAGFWSAYDDPSFASAHSGSNYAYNAYGADSLFFSFAAPVQFNGAWFALAQGTVEEFQATQIRLRDDLGHLTNWLTLAENGSASFLDAQFQGATTIWVDRLGGTFDFPGRVFTIDDVTYNQPVPEPSTMLLLGSGLVGLAARYRLRHRKQADTL